MQAHELRRKAAELREKIRTLVNLAESENRETNADEDTLVDGWKAEAESLDRRAKKIEEVEAAVASPAPARSGSHIETDTIESGEQEDEKRSGFGDFLNDIVTVTDRKSSIREAERARDRIEKMHRSQYKDYRDSKSPEKRTLVANSGISGGYTMPTGFRAEVLRYTVEQAIVRPRARVIPMQELEIEIPQLDASTVPTGGSAHFGGVRMQWSGETADKPETEPTFKQAKLVAHELSGFAKISRTLLTKSPISVDSLLFQLFGESAAREEDRAFFRGNLGGRPLGIHFAPALVTTAARGSASAITFANATAVWTRVHADYRARGVWVASQAAESAVLSMTGTANGVFYPSGVYSAPNVGSVNAGAQGGLAGVMLYMRPVLVSSLLPALNTAGDFGFYDFSQYLVGDPGLMEVATSEHFAFRSGEIAFRLIHYVAGMPWPASALTLDDGSTTVSPFVALGIQ